MAEAEDLTAEQTEKLLQFQDLTGIEDMERCKHLLGLHHWDMEVAVQSQFSEQEGIQSAFSEPPAAREQRSPQVNTHPLDQRIYTVARPRPQGLVQWGYFIVLFPFRFVYGSLLDILRFAYRLLRPDPRRYVTDPVGDVTKFIDKFEETYGETHPTFNTGSYSQALSDAKKELKFLLVYLHGDDHQDSPQFCRTTLCNDDVVEYVNTRLLFWACNTNSPEGYRVSQALKENMYPFMALIVLRQSRMTVVARVEGPIEPADLIDRLTHVMEDNETSLIAARLEREERSFNQSLRDEQDQAYQESLKADQEKERIKREGREKKEREVEEEKEKQLEEQRKVEEIAQRKEELRDEIPLEPDGDDPDAVKLLLKLPNGTRLERRFLKTDSLLHLFNYVFVHEAAPDDFQIVTNFPRRTLPCQPTDDNPVPPTFAEVGIGKSELLFVHDNEA